jgi:hypothetical protein
MPNSWRDSFGMSLHGGDVFSRRVERWMVYPTPCIGLRLKATHRGDGPYLQDTIWSYHSDDRWHSSGEGKLPKALLPDEGLVLLGICLWNITHSKWFTSRRCISPGSIMILFRHVPQA